ncbi:hypothetical protein DSS3P1_54 [Ruegeria phage DSS3-P1]|uniref:hypothetical protein n=1 Tax=Ruegeria phage DSS3-P1 TaxID=1555208 RepID=UPI0002357CF3|nr:hypothetical protein DSS3P1_54 [Ruegeria phage DSS3-P1]YP_009997191.1 hypothetical protein JT311_gp57 [Ruegeria phage vB_RpoS-V16]YP_009997271.1 hypothetical protein JT312_gp54 [Ruegeria phage vB_RpoS-V18]YP_009997353.1 hypothetical protein JT313_gp54 [Ruegeria phage vB_RpoS-V11]YP_009997436.1 hypothetical protein JT314_gp55 [Ruegeria phage vB_RpoS-V7]AET42267.1 hypothetical protein SDSG_00001 [Ruegeria phage DSS3-P1]AIT13289.1 hypothetical protein DSS3P1_54 [Ruegeria phage DSS3-P1]AWY087
MSFRDLKNRSRLSLHQAMSFPAIYVDLDTLAETACRVRYHDRQQAFGDMAGFDYAPAERVETVPKIIVLASEVSAKRGGVFSVSATEAYTVENVLPPDGITVTIEVTRMRQSEIDAAVLPVPEA